MSIICGGIASGSFVNVGASESEQPYRFRLAAGSGSRGSLGGCGVLVTCPSGSHRCFAGESEWSKASEKLNIFGMRPQAAPLLSPV